MLLRIPLSSWTVALAGKHDDEHEAVPLPAQRLLMHPDLKELQPEMGMPLQVGEPPLGSHVVVPWMLSQEACQDEQPEGPTGGGKLQVHDPVSARAIVAAKARALMI